MASDDTDMRGEIQRLTLENVPLWKAMDELMRDQTDAEKRLDRLEKAKRLKPPAGESSE